MSSFQDLSGLRFGKWIVIERYKYKSLKTKKSTKFWCKCDCGKIKDVHSNSLKAGESRGCGSCARSGEKNNQWKGKKVSITGLHTWLRNKLKKPKFCQICLKVKPDDLANISPTYNKKTYTRDFKNWEWLCRLCHMTKDGRLIQSRKNLKIWRKNKGVKNG